MVRTVWELAQAAEGAYVVGRGDVAVNDIAYDSRTVQPGALFVCWKGAHYDGHAFAPEAVRRGAAALLCEHPLTVLAETPQIVVPEARRALGDVAAAFFGHPSHRLRVIGVTGTNGKTTSTYLIKGVLEAAGVKTGLIGTIANLIGDRTVPAERTTPEAPDIQRLFAAMLEAGCSACVMEVSSHGIALHRTRGSRFAVGVFTNLTQDHLDYHPTFEDYRDTKVRLFTGLTEAAVINADDPHAGYFMRAASAPVLRYGIRDRSAEFRAEDIAVTPSGVSYTAHTPEGAFPVRLALTGLFNVYNSLGALAVGYRLGVAPEQVAEGLAGIQVPGRFERVTGPEHPFAVIVDYAHTPDGLRNVLQTARTITRGRVIAVFGAGGDRDRSKRPLMGRVVAELADYAVITSDNPRSEDPKAICAEIEAGVRQAGMPQHAYAVIINRREAIRHAIGLAAGGDLVLIAGKGHETYQEIAGTKFHFDDRDEARLALEERFGNAAVHGR